MIDNTPIKERALKKAEELKEESKSMEAIASVTYTLVSPNGYPILFTMRGDSEMSLFDRMDEVEMFLQDAKYTAGVQRGSYSKQEKPKDYADGSCPKCGSRLIKFTSKSGKSGTQCEKRKYDFNTKTTTGCDYIAWESDGREESNQHSFNPSATATFAGQGQSNGATMSQKNLILSKAPELWSEGLTKSGASAIIDSLMNK